MSQKKDEKRRKQGSADSTPKERTVYTPEDWDSLKNQSENKSEIEATDPFEDFSEEYTEEVFTNEDTQSSDLIPDKNDELDFSEEDTELLEPLEGEKTTEETNTAIKEIEEVIKTQQTNFESKFNYDKRGNPRTASYLKNNPDTNLAKKVNEYDFRDPNSLIDLSNDDDLFEALPKESVESIKTAMEDQINHINSTQTLLSKGLNRVKPQLVRTRQTLNSVKNGLESVQAKCNEVLQNKKEAAPKSSKQ